MNRVIVTRGPRPGRGLAFAFVIDNKVTSKFADEASDLQKWSLAELQLLNANPHDLYFRGEPVQHALRRELRGRYVPAFMEAGGFTSDDLGTEHFETLFALRYPELHI